MNEQNYTCTIITNVSANKAFETIGNSVPEWWTKQFEGTSNNLDDVFIVRFGEAEITIRTVAFVPAKKIFWRVIDCNLPWLKDKIAWKDTKIVWHILPGNNCTQISMIHMGLTPQKECYIDGASGWDFFIKENLFNLLNQHQSLKNTKKDNASFVEEDYAHQLLKVS